METFLLIATAVLAVLTTIWGGMIHRGWIGREVVKWHGVSAGLTVVAAIASAIVN